MSKRAAVSADVRIGGYTPAAQATPSTPSMPWKASLLLGAGTFVVGSVAPLYDSYVPALLQRHLSSSAGVGAAMGIDNVLALLVVPLIGARSDGTRSRPYRSLSDSDCWRFSRR